MGHTNSTVGISEFSTVAARYGKQQFQIVVVVVVVRVVVVRVVVVVVAYTHESGCWNGLNELVRFSKRLLRVMDIFY
jgi:uncharacterized membrane protein AbrB (regulator of aidB expression)